MAKVRDVRNIRSGLLQHAGPDRGLLGGEAYAGGILHAGPGVADQLAASHQRFQDVAGTQGLAAAMRDPVHDQLGHQVAGNFDFTGGIGLGGVAGMTKAYHATDGVFDKFDFSKVGSFTKHNVTDADPNSWPMRLARLGVWFSDKDLSGPMYTATVKQADLKGSPKEFQSLDDLAAYIEAAGGAMKARKALRDEGHDLVQLPDEEFGGTSYVALHPRAISIIKD